VGSVETRAGGEVKLSIFHYFVVCNFNYKVVAIREIIAILCLFKVIDCVKPIAD
jgi:hypothetical protein